MYQQWSFFKKTILKRNPAVLCTLFFFLFSLISLNLRGLTALVSYFGLLGVIFYPLLRIGVKGFHFGRLKRIVAIIFLTSSVIYLFFFNKIASIELWGDEIGVLNLSELPFENISSNVFSRHASVPPLDYWNMHFFRYVVMSSPVQYQEFFYRVPYMFFHIMSTIFFVIIIHRFLQDKPAYKSTLLKNIILFLAYLMYFFHPLLFVYSLEVRFYALAILGVMISFCLYFYKKLNNLYFLPLLLLFTLNSIFQFLIVIPIVSVAYCAKQVSFKNFLLYLSSFGSMALLIFVRLQEAPTISSDILEKKILDVLFQLLNINLMNNAVALMFASIMLAAFYRKRAQVFFFILIFIFQIASITLISYMKGYFDFHIRHYLFAVPTFLLLLFYSITVINNKKLIFLFMIIFTFVGMSWLLNSVALLKSENGLTKSPAGAKEIVSLAKKNNQFLVYSSDYRILGINTMEDPDFVSRSDFYLSSYIWYAQKYNLEMKQATTLSDACAIFNENPSALRISIIPNEKCNELSTLIFQPASVQIEVQYAE